jgi:DNA uptake protein ComE-like DNA-binding protein
MKRSIIQSALIAAALLSSVSVCIAVESKAAAPAQSTGKSKAADTSAKAKKATAPTKAVDINSATKAQLKKLPGVTDEDADKIIAGRPYLSKAHLVTRSPAVISRTLYNQLQGKIVAAQKPEATKK